MPDASRALLYECEAIAVTAPNERAFRIIAPMVFHSLAYFVEQRVFSLPLKKARWAPLDTDTHVSQASDRVADLTALLASPEWADLTALKGALGGAGNARTWRHTQIHALTSRQYVCR